MLLEFCEIGTFEVQAILLVALFFISFIGDCMQSSSDEHLVKKHGELFVFFFFFFFFAVSPFNFDSVGH